MKILCVDVGTGTQDILLYDSSKEIENCLKMVMPSPTLRVAQRVKEATRRSEAIILTGVMMGGGPSHWAVLDHVRAGHKVYATSEAARTFDDELDKVERMGIRVVSDEEAHQLDEEEERTVVLRDFDYAMIQAGFAAFGVDLDPAGLALAVFDHGNAPAGYSDRQFRFDYLEQRIRAENRLSAFAHLRGDVPDHLTRLKAVEASAASFEGEVLLMDTAPAAVLGALLDPMVSAHQQAIVCNVGNFHTLAFRLGEGGIDGVFEHHTGEITREQLDGFIAKMMTGALEHREVFDSMGHGALMFDRSPVTDRFLAVVGPRRSLMRDSAHHPYFAVPLGDMMIAGCFGLLRAYADRFPAQAAEILASLHGSLKPAVWET
ncbi:MAG: DUF1786 domain-containing protein [Chloroflexi bacterium]|nr:DUF1786 domain-containing protein [Chloroflexota bacterium]